MKNRIQFYHYYVLKSCVLYHYTHFLTNKFRIKEKKIKLTLSLNYQIMEKICEGIDTILCNGARKHREPHRGRENHLKSFFFFLFFYHIIILNFNDKIMEKEPVRLFTTFQCDGTTNTGNHIQKEDTI